MEKCCSCHVSLAAGGVVSEQCATCTNRQCILCVANRTSDSCDQCVAAEPQKKRHAPWVRHCTYCITGVLNPDTNTCASCRMTWCNHCYGYYTNFYFGKNIDIPDPLLTNANHNHRPYAFGRCKRHCFQCRVCDQYVSAVFFPCNVKGCLERVCPMQTCGVFGNSLFLCASHASRNRCYFCSARAVDGCLIRGQFTCCAQHYRLMGGIFLYLRRCHGMEVHVILKILRLLGQDVSSERAISRQDLYRLVVNV